MRAFTLNAPIAIACLFGALAGGSAFAGNKSGDAFSTPKSPKSEEARDLSSETVDRTQDANDPKDDALKDDAKDDDAGLRRPFHFTGQLENRD